MAELTRVFTAARMNKDLDERLVPSGEYRDALNLQIATSTTSNVGTFQNIKGNLEKKIKSYNSSTQVYTYWASGYIDQLQNASCVGSIADNQSEYIYWFISSDTASVIASYNSISGVVAPLIVDTQNILKFSPNYLITGVNILEGMLIWTDNQTEPKNILIQDWVGSTVDFLTHSQIYGRNFVEADTTTIKKRPLISPTVTANDSGRGGNGTGLNPVSTLVSGVYQNFTYIPDPLEPLDYASLPTYAEDNLLGSITISTAPAPTNYKALDLISLEAETTSATNEVTKYGITLLVVGPLDASGTLIPGNTLQCQIQAISSIIPRGEFGVLNWTVTLIEDSALFEYNFPRFAYRWKYKNNQVSGYSPFTNPVFVGGKFEYLSSDGYNIGMINNTRQIILSNLQWGDESVAELEILYKASNSNAVYAVDSLKDRSITSFTIEKEVIGAIVESNQLLRPYDNVPRVAKAQEITANRLIYGNYTQQYDLVEPSITVSLQSNTHPGATDQNTGNPQQEIYVRSPFSSLKSLRTYQLGANFLDQYGRETPVFTSNSSALSVPVSASSKINKIAASLIGSTIPSFATHFKYFVKETSNEYYNLALDRFYFAEDGNIWLSFPSSERNKVTEESYLILKKEHDNNNPVPVKARFKILAIESEAPDFIATSTVSIAESNVTTTATNNPGEGVLQFTFNGPDVTTNQAFNQGFVAENFIIISEGSNKTNEYAISSGGPTGTGSEYKVSLQEALGVDAAFLDDLPVGKTFTINIKKKIVEKKPEYEGRFFVKINRDINFDNYVIASFAGFEPTYGILESVDVPDTIVNAGPNSSTRGDRGPGFADTKAPDNNWQTKIRKPVSGQTWFGVGYAGFGNGEKPWNAENRASPSIPLLDDYLSATNTKIRFFDANGNKSNVYIIKSWEDFYDRRGWSGRTTMFNSRKAVRVELDNPFEAGFNPAGIEILQEISADTNNILSSANPAIFETEPREAIDIDIYYQASSAIPIAEYNQTKILDWHNCYSYGNGVESNRIRDDFNAPIIDKGPIVSAPLDVPYKKEIKKNSLIFSQIFNSISGVNNLNQFIQAEAITKDILPEYGSIQKLRSRDTNLVTLCEDKCLYILADKDALYNADGNTNLTASNRVLGQAVPYGGEFGISTNPESFAEFGYRIYFTDKTRGTVIRLSMDGITEIADKGMDTFFNDNLRLNNRIFGSWDGEAKEYNVTLNNLSSYWQNALGVGKVDRLNKNPECDTFINSLPTYQTTLSFKEEVDGWTSRKSYIPEYGISLNGLYYTFKNGKIWEHYTNPIHNNFYGIGQDHITLGKYNESSFTAILNDGPLTVKSYNTLNYTGSNSLEYQYTVNGYGARNFSIAELQANNLIPLTFSTKPGWYTNYIQTDLQEGEVKEFVDKEGKKFNYIKGLETFFTTNCNTNVDTSEFNVQGIGRPSSITGDINTTKYSVTVYIDPTCSI